LTESSKWRLSKKGDEWHTADIDRFESPVDVRCRLLYLLASKITTCIIAHRPTRMCDIGFILSARKSQHASSRVDRLDSPVDVRYRVLYSLGQKITTCIIAHRPGVCNSSPFLDNLYLERFVKSVNHKYRLICTPNEDFGNRNRRSGVSFRGTFRGCEYSIWETSPRKVPRKDTRCSICAFVSLGQKITTCIITHRPTRFAGRCAISGFVFNCMPPKHSSDQKIARFRDHLSE